MSRCENKHPCPCTYSGCPHHGKCCDCIAFHNRMGEIPGCLFSKAGEAKWDRSFEAFAKDRRNA